LGDYCKIKIHHEKDPLLTIIGSNPLESTYYAQCEEGRLAYVNTEYTYGSYNTYELKEIIGKDPMLNDVLEWINKTCNRMNKETIFHACCISWQLSFPYLKDQSHELINFLHGLIKK
jgi:hypothetical protein